MRLVRENEEEARCALMTIDYRWQAEKLQRELYRTVGGIRGRVAGSKEKLSTEKKKIVDGKKGRHPTTEENYGSSQR